jgi:hypothetical protein
MPVILVMWQAEVGESWFKANPSKKKKLKEKWLEWWNP